MQVGIRDDGALNIEIVEMSFLLFMNKNVVNVGHVYGHRVTSR